MENLVLDKKFTTSINFFDNILFLDSFDNNKNTITVEFKTNSIDLTGDNAVTYALKK